MGEEEAREHNFLSLEFGVPQWYYDVGGDA